MTHIPKNKLAYKLEFFDEEDVCTVIIYIKCGDEPQWENWSNGEEYLKITKVMLSPERYSELIIEAVER